MVENWWTYEEIPSDRIPLEIAIERVHYWLILYPHLLRMAEASSGGAFTYGNGGAGPYDPSRMRAWERAVTTKADLDIALRCCTERQREAIRARFHRGLPEREAGQVLSGSPDIHRLCERARITMAKKLIGDNSKTGG